MLYFIAVLVVSNKIKMGWLRIILKLANVIQNHTASCSQGSPDILKTRQVSYSYFADGTSEVIILVRQNNNALLLPA